MGVLTRGGHSYSAGTVKVEMGQLVGQPLQLVGLKPALVHDNVVAGRVDGALPDRLGHQEEIVPLRQGHSVVDDGAAGRIAVGSLARAREETRVDPFAHDDKSYHWVEICCQLSNSFLQAFDLVLDDV